MKTEEIALSRLVENEDNPREITTENFERLIKSLVVFPKMLELRPVVIDEQYKVLGGNMRTRALQRIGKMNAAELRGVLDSDGRFTEGEKLAIIDYWETWKGNKTVKVVKADELTEGQKREFIIKDNAAFGDWDVDKLANEWHDIPLMEWGIRDWIFNEEETADEGEPNAYEDNYKENESAIPRVNYGDVWQLGEHRLMCGDSTDEEQVKKLCNGIKMNLLVTDPPYGVSYTGRKHVVRENIANDNLRTDMLTDFLTDALHSADEVMEAGAAFYIWFAYGNVTQFNQALENVGWIIRQNLIWYKNHFSLSRSDYQWIHEPCIYGWKNGNHYFCNDRNLATVWQDEKPEDYAKMKKSELVDLVRKLTSPTVPTTIIQEPKPANNELHPTMKPVRLFAAHIRNSSQKGQNVLDLFGGSGTTIIAAEQMGRRAFVMEFDKKYCDSIISRWEQLTGKVAVRLNENDVQ